MTSKVDELIRERSRLELRLIWQINRGQFQSDADKVERRYYTIQNELNEELKKRKDARKYMYE